MVHVKNLLKLGMVVNAYSSSTQKAEAGGSPQVRPCLYQKTKRTKQKKSIEIIHWAIWTQEV